MCGLKADAAVGDFNVLKDFRNTVDGRLTSSKHTRHGINPADGSAMWEVPVATLQDVDAAVAAGKRAFTSWSQTPYAKRREALVAFADAVELHAQSFAELLTMEQGKPLQMGALEIAAGIRWLRSVADIELTEEIVSEDEKQQTVVRYTPLGLCIGIVPWNFPVHLACGKIGPALVTGNTIIIKPSPLTPYCGLKMGELAQQFFPPGVFQVLSGDDNLGPWLTAHPGPDKISFTGSTFTGKKVMEAASKTLKRVTLELGGKDPAVVCSDVDIDAVAPKIAAFAFSNSGQICVAIKRVYVHESIYTQFKDALVRSTKMLKVGPGREEAVFMGPVQNAAQFERVKTFISDIETENLTVAFGGTMPKSDQKGYFITPTIIDQPADESRIMVEEPFGPIIPLTVWKDEDEVISRANNTKMGLGASVWSKDLVQAARIARRLDAGNVWINDHLALSPTVPFGGHKESGIGCEWGSSGLKGYCNSQTLFLKK